jgi:hypothetical protein
MLLGIFFLFLDFLCRFLLTQLLVVIDTTISFMVNSKTGIYNSFTAVQSIA